MGGTLSVFTLPNGGIVDDLIVMKAEGKDVALELLDDRGLIALQGPSMIQCLQPLTNLQLDKLSFMHSAVARVAGIDCRVTRCGYTGEDGVELSCPAEQTQALAEAILGSEGSPCLAGLGARDSLRLEAGLCLYGNDIDESTSPIEAGLAWTVAKPRRASQDFPGAEVILDQLKNGVSRRRVGLLSKGAPARGSTVVTSLAGHQVGIVTSGCPSPSLGKGTNVSMAYVEKPSAKAGTELILQVRGKAIPATVTKMPFVPTNYFVGK